MSSSISSGILHKTVLIYNDIGSIEASCLALREELYKYFESIVLVEAHYLKTAFWEQHTALVVLPGGRCSQMIELLGSEGQKKIQEFVKIHGGKLFGVCAGFYYLPQFSFYHYKSECYDKKRDYPLIAGKVKGPLTSPDVAEVVTIYTPSGKKGGCYAQGNPVYCGSSNIASEIIGTYEETNDSGIPDESIAIAAFQSGDGYVAGSAVHLEFKPPRTRSPFESDIMCCLYDRMTEAEDFRISLLEDVLNALFPDVHFQALSSTEYDDADLSPRKADIRDDRTMASSTTLSIASTTNLSSADFSFPTKRGSTADLSSVGFASPTFRGSSADLDSLYYDDTW